MPVPVMWLTKHAFTAWLQQAQDHMGGADILVPNVSGMGLAGEEGWKLAFDIDIMSTVRGSAKH